MKSYALVLGLAACTPTPHITAYDALTVDKYGSLDACLEAASTSDAAHAYCTPTSYAPETSIRPKPRPKWIEEGGQNGH